nr:thiol:disulfide interchange protein [Salmonella sp. NCTC 7297]
MAGGLLMALGGLLCLSDPRYRKRTLPETLRRRPDETQRTVITVTDFSADCAALLWQLARNAEGDDPAALESALTGKPVPAFRLESLDRPGSITGRRR